jgi:hypothetical protein
MPCRAPPPSHCIGPRPRIWWYPEPLPPLQAARNQRFSFLHGLVERSSHFTSDGDCADFYIISHHVHPVRSNALITEMFDNLAQRWPYWNQTAGLGLLRHLVVMPCDLASACMWENSFFFQRDRRHLWTLRPEIDPTSTKRRVGFLTPNGAEGPYNFFLRGVDVRLPHDAAYSKCGPYCGVPRPLRWRLGPSILRRYSPWAISERMARRRALRARRPIQLLWSGWSSGWLNVRPTLIRHHINRSRFLLRDTSPKGRAANLQSAVDLDGSVDGLREYAAPHWLANMMRQSDFCFSPPGQNDGCSDRYLPAILYGCVPVFVGTRHEEGPFGEELVPWENISLQVAPKDLPLLHERLAAVSPQQLTRMRRAMRDVWPRMLWRDRPRGASREAGLVYTRTSREDDLDGFLSAAEATAGPGARPARLEDAFESLVETLRRRLRRERESCVEPPQEGRGGALE